MPELPSGTVTFLFTDVEGSTRLWQEHPAAIRSALARHDAILRRAVESHDGRVFKTVGDACHASFLRVVDALAAALQAQQALQAEPWGETGPLRVRMALHTGDAEERDGDYLGQALNRTSRILDAAHGGQVLLSAASYELVRDELPAGAALRDLGEHRLRDLTRPEHLFQLLAMGLRLEFPSLRSLESYPSNLPLQLTSFVGREREMAEVRRLLGATRLLTLTGSGGCGKTRLSLQVAASVLDQYPDGAWLVDLAPLGDPSLVLQAVADALGVREEPAQPLPATLLRYLGSKRFLLILDNCEHLLAASAELAEALLRGCPSLQVLATSREALGCVGEVTWRVPSLPMPVPGQLPVAERLSQYEAVRLFVERALAVQPGFAVTNENAPSVAQVCWRLDGIPLALELAAARVRELTAEQIAARLDDRFRLLTGGSRTVLRRQQTLRAAIDWSYDLLLRPERVLFRRVAAFAGAWTLAAAEAVCAGDGIQPWEVLDLSTALVRKSLASLEEQAGQGRYRLPESIREYGLERLVGSPDVATVRQRHAEYFVALARQWQSDARSSEEVELDLPELRAALRWCLEAGQTEQALCLADALGRHWQREGLGRGGPVADGRAGALGGLADATARVSVLCFGQMITCWQGDLGAARQLADEALSIARRLGDSSSLSLALIARAWTSLALGEHREAAAQAEEALSLAREASRAPRARAALYVLGTVAHAAGDERRARALLEECVRLSESRQLATAAARVKLGHVLLAEGASPAAAQQLALSLTETRPAGFRRFTAAALAGLAGVALARGQPQRSARLFGAAAALLRRLGAALDPDERADNARAEATARAKLGEAAFAAAYAAGLAMTLEQAVEYALADDAAADSLPAERGPVRSAGS